MSPASGTVAKPSLDALFLRLFTAYLFHMMNYVDIDAAYRRLKFLRFNADKFDDTTLWCAFMTTQYQFIIGVICEGAAYFYICKQSTLINIIMNYLSFKGITILDDMFATSQRKLLIRDAMANPKYAEIFEQAFTFDKESKKRDEGKSNTIANPHHTDSKLDWLVNMFIIVVFTIQKVFYKAIYFYALPYAVVFLTYYLLTHQAASTTS